MEAMSCQNEVNSPESSMAERPHVDMPSDNPSLPAYSIKVPDINETTLGSSDHLPHQLNTPSDLSLCHVEQKNMLANIPDPPTVKCNKMLVVLNHSFGG